MASAPAPELARWAARLFIVGFLAWQVATPLRYYLGEDPLDERFAWRMFSSRWLAQRLCDVSYSETVADAPGAPVDAGADRAFDDTWLPVLRRGSPRAVEALLEHRCARSSHVESVEFRRTCPAPGGASLQTLVSYDCQTREFDADRGIP